MLSRRLTQKLEALSDEAQAHLEQQADLLLTMPEHRRQPRTALRLVTQSVPPPADFRRVVAASHGALNTRRDATPLQASTHIQIGTLAALTATRLASPAKATSLRRRVFISFNSK
jgi:hypothetical protein